MTQLDNLFGPLAQSLLRQFGKTVVYNSIVTGTPDDTTLTVAETTTSFSLYAAIMRPARNEFDGDMIRIGDRKMMTAYREFPVTPKPGDTVTIDGETWKVMMVNPTFSGEVAAAYDIFVRS